MIKGIEKTSMRGFIIDSYMRPSSKIPRYEKKIKYNPTRKEVDQKVQEFLSKGGKIEKVPFGVGSGIVYDIDHGRI